MDKDNSYRLLKWLSSFFLIGLLSVNIAVFLLGGILRDPKIIVSIILFDTIPLFFLLTGLIVVGLLLAKKHYAVDLLVIYTICIVIASLFWIIPFIQTLSDPYTTGKHDFKFWLFSLLVIIASDISPLILTVYVLKNKNILGYNQNNTALKADQSISTVSAPAVFSIGKTVLIGFLVATFCALFISIISLLTTSLLIFQGFIFLSMLFLGFIAGNVFLAVVSTEWGINKKTSMILFSLLYPFLLMISNLTIRELLGR